MSKFKSTHNRGFQMTFANGWTISVQWGQGNYCDNRNLDGNPFGMQPNGFDSTTAEIAIWDNNDNRHCHYFGSDEVKGFCKTDEVAYWIERVSKW